jgi:hypothetical protein
LATKKAAMAVAAAAALCTEQLLANIHVFRLYDHTELIGR